MPNNTPHHRKISQILRPLQFAARHGRLCLVLGLVAGLTLESLALTIKGWLPHLVAFLLCVSAMRVGLRAVLGTLPDAKDTSRAILVLQLALPLIALAAVLILGIETHPLAVALILMLSAPSISGAPNFTALMGHDPAPPMRLLILGTAAFPITAIASLWIVPAPKNPKTPKPL